MFRIKSNGEKAYAALKARLNLLANTDRITKQAAFDTAALIQARVQQRGQAVDGTMKPYAASTVKQRRKQGRQVNYKDLTFRGDLFRNWTVSPVGKTSYAVGFLSKRSGDIARYQEAREGTIFELSRDEQQTVQTAIENQVKQILS